MIYLSAYLLLQFFCVLYFLIERSGSGRLKIFAWSAVGLDLLLIGMQVRYASSTRTGIIPQLFSNPTLAIVFCLAQLIPLLHFLPEGLERYRRYAMKTLMLIYAALFMVVIVNTQTRGALVGLGLGVIVMAIILLLRRGERKIVRIISGAGIALLIGAIALIFVFKGTPAVRHNEILWRIASISLNDSTTSSRVATWEAGLEGFYSKPILGWGVESFQQAFNLHFPVRIYTDEGTPLWFDRPHNLLIQYLVEGGVIGFGLYLALLIVICIALLKKFKGSSYVGILFTGLIIAYVGQNLFVFDSINSYVPFYFLLAFTVSLAFRDESSQSHTASPVSVKAAYAYPAILITVIAVVCAVYFINVRPLEANGEFVTYYREETNSTNQVYKPDATQKIFAVIDASPYLGRAELLGVYSEFAVGLLQNDTSVSDADFRALVDGLVQRFDRERQQGYNSDARFDMFELNLYLNAGKLDPKYYQDLLTLAERSIPLSPDRPQMYYIRGRAYMSLHRFADGIADFQHAVALAPTIPDAHMNLFAGYATIGDSAKAQAEVEKLKTLQSPLSIDSYARLTSIYVSSKMYDNAIALIQDGMTIHPESKVDLYIGLAQVYAAAGKNKEARAAMQAAVQLDPSVSSYATDFYQRLDAGQFITKQ